MRREVVNEAIRAFVETSLPTVKADIGKIPSSYGNKYVVLYPLDWMPVEDGWNQRFQKTHDAIFQFTCVGIDERAAARLSSDLHEAIVGKTGANDYKNSIEIPNAHVAWRLCDSLGAILPSGPDLFQSDDTYRMRIADAQTQS